MMPTGGYSIGGYRTPAPGGSAGGGTTPWSNTGTSIGTPGVGTPGTLSSGGHGVGGNPGNLNTGGQPVYPSPPASGVNGPDANPMGGMGVLPGTTVDTNPQTPNGTGGGREGGPPQTDPNSGPSQIWDGGGNMIDYNNNWNIQQGGPSASPISSYGSGNSGYGYAAGPAAGRSVYGYNPSTSGINPYNGLPYNPSPQTSAPPAVNPNDKRMGDAGRMTPPGRPVQAPGPQGRPVPAPNPTMMSQMGMNPFTQFFRGMMDNGGMGQPGGGYQMGNGGYQTGYGHGFGGNPGNLNTGGWPVYPGGGYSMGNGGYRTTGNGNYGMPGGNMYGYNPWGR